MTSCTLPENGNVRLAHAMAGLAIGLPVCPERWWNEYRPFCQGKP